MSVSCRVAGRAGDQPDLVPAVGVDNGHDASQGIGANCDETVFAACVGVFAGEAGRVRQHRFGVLERDSVLGEVRSRLGRIPSRVHSDNMYVYMYCVNAERVAKLLRVGEHFGLIGEAARRPVDAGPRCGRCATLEMLGGNKSGVVELRLRRAWIA